MLTEPLSSSGIDVATKATLEAFLSRIHNKYKVMNTYLFGSRAKGDFRSDSDIDLAVVFDSFGTIPTNKARTNLAIDMADMAFQVLLETGLRVQPVPILSSELSDPALFSNPELIKNILRHGVAV